MSLKQLLTNLNPFKKEEVSKLPAIPLRPLEPPKKELIIKPKNRDYSYEQQIFIAECIGHHMNSVEIAHDFEEAFGVRLNNPASMVRDYKASPTFQPIIEKARKKFESNPHPVAGAYKNVRLERVERAHRMALRNGDPRAILLTSEQQRKEYEKHEYNQINILQQQYINMSDEELVERQKWIAEKLKLGGKNGKIGISSKEGT